MADWINSYIKDWAKNLHCKSFMYCRHLLNGKWQLQSNHSPGQEDVVWKIISYIFWKFCNTLKVKVKFPQWCPILWDSMDYPWNSLGQNTGVGSLSLLQGTFPAQGLKPGLSHCRQILYQLSHKASPRILEWVAYAFFRGSSWPRNWTRVSCITGRFFTNWATREAL